MKRIQLALAALLLATSAYAQSGSSVRQSGNITPNHAASWVSNGIIGDGGTASDSPITSLGVTSNTTAGFCVSSGRATAAGRQQLCMGAPLNAPGIISVQNYGSAIPQGLNFVINGVTASFPASGGDFITGTGPYTVGGVPCFLNTSGNVHDCGVSITSGVITAGTWQGTPVALGYGGTGGNTASAARTNLGLGSIATQSASAVAITGGTITGMPSPTLTSDVATKSYVDATSAGLNILAQSTLATAAVLPNAPTYSNGASGVGATLTAGSNITLTVDGTAAPLNTVVLVKNQASALQNGIYTVTTAGSGGAPWVLTRATYFDQAAEMKAGSYTFITGGATLSNSSYTLQTAVTTVGTDAVTFVQFSAGTGGVTSIAGNSGAFTLGSGITNSTNKLLLYSDPGSITDCTLVVTGPGNALTIALKTKAGNDPSASEPCTISFRNATAATGDYTAVDVTAATSFATGSTGSSLGATSGATPFRVWVTAWNNAGTVVLGVSNQTGSGQIYPIDESNVQSSTACNGCADATSAGVFYTTAAQTSKAIRILGYLNYEAGLATAGTWNVLPTRTVLMGTGIKKPGESVQRVFMSSSTGTSTSTPSFSATAVAQNFTKASAANPVRYDVAGSALSFGMLAASAIRLYRGNAACTTAIGILAVTVMTDINYIAAQSLTGVDLPTGSGSTSAQYTLCVNAANSIAITFPYSGSGAQLVLEEIQG